MCVTPLPLQSHLCKTARVMFVPDFQLAIYVVRKKQNQMYFVKHLSLPKAGLRAWLQLQKPVIFFSTQMFSWQQSTMSKKLNHNPSTKTEFENKNTGDKQPCFLNVLTLYLLLWCPAGFFISLLQSFSTALQKLCLCIAMTFFPTIHSNIELYSQVSYVQLAGGKLGVSYPNPRVLKV